MELMEKARELGIALAGSDEYKRMLAAQVNVQSNDSLRALLDEFKEKRAKLVSALSEGDFDNTNALELSADIERLQSQMLESPLFSDMIEAEKSFHDLIGAVDAEINACVDGSSAIRSCRGNCSGCDGCIN